MNRLVSSWASQQVRCRDAREATVLCKRVQASERDEDFALGRCHDLSFVNVSLDFHRFDARQGHWKLFSLSLLAKALPLFLVVPDQEKQ